MAKKYLDDTGMSYFWGKLKAYFQEKLVSGTNIKTINNETLLGSGNISVTSIPSGLIPKMAVAIRNASTAGTVSLGTSHKIIGCPSSLTATSDEFYFTSDGGIRVLKAGVVFAIAYVDIHSTTSGDEVAVAIGSYQGGWKFESDIMKSTEAATNRSMMVFGVTTADANDSFYLRARNSTAARGVANNAKLVVLHLS